MATPRNPGIPGLDTIEPSPEADWARQQAAKRASLRAAPPPAAAPEMPAANMGQRLRGGLSAAGDAARSGVSATRQFLTGGTTDVGGALRSVGRGVYTGGKWLARKSAPVAAGIGVVQGFGTDTEQYAKRFGLEDTQPGVLRDLGVRALGVASDVGNAFTGGQLGKHLFRDLQDQPAQPPVPSIKTPPPAAVPQAVDGPVPGGDNPIQFAPAVVAQPAAAQPAQQPTQPQPDVAAIDARTAAINAESRRLRQGLDAYGPGAHGGSGMTGFASSPLVTARNQEQFDRDRVRYLAEQELNRGGGRGRGAALAALAQSQQGGEAERIAQLRESGANLRAGIMSGTQRDVAGMNAAAARDRAELGARVTMRGQDITAEGNQLRTQASMAAARQQALEKQRQYDLDVAKYGLEEAKTMQTRREAAEKAMTTRVGNMFRTTDPKTGRNIVDDGAVGDFLTHLSATQGGLIERLRASNDPADQKLADRVAKEGMTALDDKHLTLFKSLYDLGQRQRQAAGILPGTADYTGSMDLFDYMPTGVEDGMFQTRIKNKAGSIGTKDLRYTEPANYMLPDILKQRSTGYDAALREAARQNPEFAKRLRNGVN